MRPSGTPALAFMVVLALLLAGCSGPEEPQDPAQPLLGVARGVVVDEAIRPVSHAAVRLQTGEATETDSEGMFRFEGLEPGEYFVRASKAGYATGQAPVSVVAGIEEPETVRVMLVFLPNRQPAMQTIVMNGFYECAMGTVVVTDSCDWVYRTGHDTASNETGGPLPAPRNVQQFHNTQYIDLPPGTQTVIQEAVWDDPQVSQMKISLDATPIDPVCDCSSSFMEVDMGSPTYARMDGERVPQGETVAARGFLPFGDPQVAVNFEFTIYTTLFMNVEPPEDWSFVEGSPRPY